MPNNPFRRLQAHVNDLRRKLDAECLEVEEANLEDAYATAVAATSGPLTRADLRRLDHPYARRHGTALLPPGVTNVESDALRSGWRKYGPVRAGGVIRSRVYNIDRKQSFLKLGTRRMVRRPVDETVTRTIAARVRGRRLLILPRVFKGG